MSDTKHFVPQVTDAHRELANQAQLEFDNKNYTSCLAILNKLSSQRNGDAHIAHNKSIVDFINGDCKRVEQLRRNLNQICYMSHLTPENAKNLDDVEHAALYYNQALILYHLKQYQASLSILDCLFLILEPMDEELAKKVMFLLVELYICTQQPEKSMGLLSFVEKSLRGAQGEGAESEPSEDSARSLNAMWRCRISQYKMCCYMMMKSFKFCKREMKSLASNSNPSAVVFCYLKSNFEYLRGNHRKAVKILLSTPHSPPITDSGQSLPVMYYNNISCIHFSLGKHNLAMFYLRKAFAENEKIVAEVSKDLDDKNSLNGRHLNQLGINRHLELAYNLGVQLLHCNKPIAAFDCLIDTVQLYHSNPRLWLRLAECCVMAYKLNNEVDSSLSCHLKVIDGSVGAGVHRKLILGTGRQDSQPNQSPAKPAPTLEFASLCLRNALMILSDKKPPSNSNVEEDTTDSSTRGDINLMRAPPSNPMRVPEVANLRSSILCSSAYVALCLNDYMSALTFSDKLLAQPKLSSAHRYLGKMYKGEALVRADGIAEAVDCFDPQQVTDVSVTPPQLRQDDSKGDKNEKEGSDSNGDNNGGVLHPWYPQDVTKARALIQYNLATSYALRGDFQKALLNLGESAKAIGTPLPAQMYSLRLYLDLIEGRRKMAQVIIKDHFGHTTPNRVDPQIANLESAANTSR